MSKEFKLSSSASFLQIVLTRRLRISIVRTVANLNLALTQIKIDFPWVSAILAINPRYSETLISRSNFRFPSGHFPQILPLITVEPSFVGLGYILLPCLYLPIIRTFFNFPWRFELSRVDYIFNLIQMIFGQQLTTIMSPQSWAHNLTSAITRIEFHKITSMQFSLKKFCCQNF